MASKQIQCDMCSNENAVGYCKTCGNVGETCVNIHTTGKMFQTHTVIMNEDVKKHTDGTENPKVILRDIIDERCKQHPNEKAIFLCNIHDSMICGRCLHSEHLSCGKEVVDLLHEVVNIDCEKVNTMKSVLKEVKDDFLFLKNEAEQSKESYKKNADRCIQECMELGNKIKRRVDELTSDTIHEITKTNDINMSTHSSITQTCNEKIMWCEDKENKIDDFVDNNLAGHLYLMHTHFEKEISDSRSHLKEIKHKHAFEGHELGHALKENKVILKCLFDDLEEVCEVTGSDDGNSNDVVTSTAKINKTRRELTALLSQLKQDLDQSEKEKNALCDELKQVKQDKDNLEKTEKALCDELQKVKQDIDNSEKKRRNLEQELLKAKQDTEEAKKRTSLEQELLKTIQGMEEAIKETAILQAKFAHLKEPLKWTQPTGTLQVKIDGCFIELDFTFPDGIQTAHHPTPGNPYKGRMFKGRLRERHNRSNNSELLCRLLKEAFRRGVIFNIGMEGKVALDGVSLFIEPLLDGGFTLSYDIKTYNWILTIIQRFEVALGSVMI